MMWTFPEAPAPGSPFLFPTGAPSATLSRTAGGTASPLPSHAGPPHTSLGKQVQLLLLYLPLPRLSKDPAVSPRLSYSTCL